MKTSLLLLATIASISLAQTTNGPCVQSCTTSKPTSDLCNGDETGAALDSCTCATFQKPGLPLITCIKACPADEIAIFAGHIPASCRNSIFPGVSASTSSTGTGASTSSGAPTQTLSSPAANSPTTTPTTKTGTSSETASPSASQTPKPSGSAAMKGAMMDTSIAVAFVGGVFALFML